MKLSLQAVLSQKQIMKLTMTQELTQAIALLQYNTQELCEFLENKAIENPLIQIESGSISTTSRHHHAEKSSKGDKQDWLEQIAKKESSIIEHLFAQIDFCSYDNKQKKILAFLINSLDENGYLSISVDEAAALLHVSHQEVEDAVHLIQGLEPVGVGARNLQECLLLQLMNEENINELAIRILSQFFIPFAEKKWKLIAAQLKIELRDIQEVFDYVQTLNPRPTSDFSSHPSSYVTPDIMIKWDGNDFIVSTFEEALPEIKFNRSYYLHFHSLHDKQVKQFLQDKKQDYQWIMKSIEQRKETIMKVALKIVEKQQDFFIHGPGHLKPMTMKEISEELNIHESTVSRAVREKYAQTPFGTFELKSFFSSAIKTTSDEDTSSKQVKKAISELIESENKLKPLSDQDLVGLLKSNDGIKVSRRTIAKYRDQLGIPASSRRKRFA
jgi:RNA polymerase sigma-54 factor